MKSILLILSFISMSNYDPERLLGKNINEASIFGEMDSFGFDNFQIIPHTEFKFLGKQLDQISITTNNDNTIKEVTLHFDKILDISFFQIIENKYGIADQAFTEDKIDEGPEVEIDGNILKESFISFKPVSSEYEQPILMHWRKDQYQIEIMVNTFDKKTKITFKQN